MAPTASRGQQESASTPAEGSEGGAASASHPSAYRGATGRTQRKRIAIGCDCGHTFRVECVSGVNFADDPHLLDAIRSGLLDRNSCPNCGAEHTPEIPRTVHEPTIGLFGLLLPPALRHEELLRLAVLFRQLEADGENVPPYVKHPQVFFSLEALNGALDAGQRSSAEQHRLLETELLRVQERELELDELEGRLRQDLKEVDDTQQRLQALAMQLHAQPRPPKTTNATATASAAKGASAPLGASSTNAKVQKTASGPKKDVDRWRASELQASAFIKDSKVTLVHRIPTSDLDRYRTDAPDFRVQLHRIEGYPLIALAAAPKDPTRVHPKGDASVASQLTWTFDYRDARHKKLLGRLAQEFDLTLDLYDQESRFVFGWHVRAPLAPNMALATGLAEQRFSEVNDASSFNHEKAVAAYSKLADKDDTQAGYPSPDWFHDLPTAGVAQLAVGVIAHWSKPGNEERLLLIHGLPEAEWGALKKRVAQGALNFGLWPGAKLAEFMLNEGLVPSRRALLEQLLSRFLTTDDSISSCDLSIFSTLHNWHQLLQACRSANFEVDPEIANKAALSARHARLLLEEEMPNGDFEQEEAFQEDDLSSDELSDDDIVGEEVLGESGGGDAPVSDGNPAPADRITMTLEVSDEDIIDGSPRV